MEDEEVYKSKTTFIIGAGASYELGFPLGHDLKPEISKLLQITGDGMRGYSFLNHQIYMTVNTLSEKAPNNKQQELQKYLNAGMQITKALPQAISIDNLINDLNNEYVSRLAKLAITICIMNAETECENKYLTNNDGELKWVELEKVWLHKFHQLLIHDRETTELEALFNNINFIIFNYDRTIEFFLAKFLINYFNLKINYVHELLSKVNFHHPYGQVGKLDWQNLEMPTHNFGDNNRKQLYEISKSILTFSEQIEDENRMSGIHQAIKTADQLVFLGFAFHKSNMDLLQTDGAKKKQRIFATVSGISEPNVAEINNRLVQLVNGSETHQKRSTLLKDNFELDDIKCTELFTKYSMPLTA